MPLACGTIIISVMKFCLKRFFGRLTQFAKVSGEAGMACTVQSVAGGFTVSSATAGSRCGDGGRSLIMTRRTAI